MKMYSIIIISLIISLTACWSNHHPSNKKMKKMELGIKSEMTGKIKAKTFTNKINQKIPEYSDFYFVMNKEEHFIKTVEKDALGKKELEKYINKKVKVQAAFQEGFLDSPSNLDEMIQSRMGVYIEIYEIVQ